ncbi:MAG: SMP-30/gluconolactonase/LRE family protein [Planctomycetota bacterium]
MTTSGFSGVVVLVVSIGAGFVAGCQPPPTGRPANAGILPEGVSVIAQGSFAHSLVRVTQDASTGDFVLFAAGENSSDLLRISREGEIGVIASGIEPAFFGFILQDSASGDFIVASGCSPDSREACTYRLLWVAATGEVTVVTEEPALGNAVAFTQDADTGDLFVISVDQPYLGAPDRSSWLSRVTPDGAVNVIASELPLVYPVDAVTDASTGDLIVLDSGSETAALVRVSVEGEVTPIETDTPLRGTMGITQDASTGDFVVTGMPWPPDGRAGEVGALLRVSPDGIVSTMVSGPFLWWAVSITQDTATGDFVVLSAGASSGSPPGLLRLDSQIGQDE